jgi:hypothetical protein
VNLRRKIALMALPLFSAGAAFAQSSPNLTYGQVPTAAMWNNFFSAKQDVLNFTPLNINGGIMTGPLITTASIATASGFNIPQGTAPSAPNNGDVWVTNSGMFVRINGVTQELTPVSGSGAFALTAATNTFLYNQIVNLNPTNPLPVALAGDVLQAAQANGTFTRIELDSFANSSVFTCARADGSASALSAVQSGEELCAFDAFGYNGAAYSATSIASVRMFAAQNFATGSLGTYIDVATTTIGSTTRINRIRFENDGGITVPSTVAGGDKGVSTINVGGIYQAGVGPLGTAAFVNTGTAGANVPLMNGANTWSAEQTLSAAFTYGGVTLANAVTGTGAMVLQNAPTITGNPTFTGTNFLTLANLASPSTAWSLLGNASGTAGSGNYAPFTIGSLVQKSTSVASDFCLISDQGAAGQLKYSLCSNVGSSSGLSSLNTLTGAVTLLEPPKGRLTLNTHTPVMTISYTNQTTLYYDCYDGGNIVNYYNGSNDVQDTIPSCEVSTAMQSTGAGILNGSGVFDVWWSSAHTICVTTNGAGGGWASDGGGSNTVRGTGYSALDFTSRPYITNKQGIAHCYNGSLDKGSIAVNQATYLGTIATGGSGVVSWTLGGAASGGSAATLGVWNYYNRAQVSTTVEDTFAMYTSGSGVIALDAGGIGSGLNNRVSYVVGVAEDSQRCEIYASMIASAGAGGVACGHDSTSVTSGLVATTQITSGFGPGAAGLSITDVGLHYLQALQTSSGGVTTYGNSESGSLHTGITYSGRW